MRWYFTYQKAFQSVEAGRNTKPKCLSEKTIDYRTKKSISEQQLIILQGKNRLPLNSSIYNFSRHSSPIFKFWKNGLFICSIDRVLIADLRNI